ncbi:MAG: AI-2E family transporter [Acetobacter sp.]|jgi:predicted PurR-regulated permease PerM
MSETSGPETNQTPSPSSGKVTLGFSLNKRQMRAREILACIIIALAIYTIQDFIPALAWGVVFAVATSPLYERACIRWPGASKTIWLPLLFTTALALLFLVPMILIAREAFREASDMLLWTQNARQDGIPVPNWVGQLPFARMALTEWWQENLTNPHRVHEFVTAFNRHSLNMSRTVGSQIVHRSTLFCFSLLTLFFLLKNNKKVQRQSLIASRRSFGKRGELIARQIIASIHGTVAGLVLVGVGEGLLMGVVYLIAGLSHAALFGVITAVAAMIPFCAMIAISIASVMIIASGAALAGIITFCIGSLIIFVADHFVRPALIGGSTELPFFWVLLGILGGAETWGLLGLFIGPAAMATAHLLWRNWTRERLCEADSSSSTTTRN